MAFCPNKNLRAWIDLEVAQPERSYQLWDEYKGNVPSKYYNVKPLLDKIKKELKFRSPLFTSELILLKSRLKDYNTKNGTSHKLNITKIGESDRHKVDLYLDYTPVNEEMRREREAIRSEEDKSFYNIEETNKEDIVNPLIEEARRIQLEDAKRAGIGYDDRYLFNQTIGIKPGVAELFESNPELANAVYEVLGKKDISDEIINSLPYKNTPIGKPNGLKIFITPHKGILVENSKGEQYELDTILDDESEVYNRTPEHVREQLSKVRELYWGNLLEHHIIQQKQQAQQLYSQYLDTIFPNSKVKDILMHGTIFNIEKFKNSKLGKYTKAPSAFKGFFFTNNKKVAESYIKTERILDQEWLYNKNKELLEKRGEINVEDIDEHIEILINLLKTSNSLGLTDKNHFYNDTGYIYAIKDKISLPIRNDNQDIIDSEEVIIDRYFKHYYSITSHSYVDIEISEKEVRDKLSHYNFQNNKNTDVINFYLNKLYAIKQLLEDNVKLPNLPIGLKKFINPIKYSNVYENFNIINYITDKYARDKIVSFEKPKPNIVYIKLDVRNPISFDYRGKKYRTVSYNELLKKGIDLNNDSAIFRNTYDSGFLKEDEYLANVYVAFNPEQIHILGSKQDIDNFANFVSYENSSYSKIGSIQQFRDYIMSKNFAAVEEFLVVNNKIDRKC